MREKSILKRIIAFLLVCIMSVGKVEYLLAEDTNDCVLEGNIECDLIAWVTQTGGMTLEERAQISMFTESQTVADYEGAKAALMEGILNWETSINITTYQIPIEDAWLLYSEVCYENPQLFYLKTGCSYSYSGNYLRSISPIYNSNFTKEDVTVYEAKVEEVLESIPNGMSEEDTALALHDYLVSHCAYDTTYSNYDAYSALVLGNAVCQGYTLAYSDLLNRCSIENEYVSSDSMNHAWNLVNVDDEWYHVDATWDDPLMGGEDLLGYVGHTNFLRSDAGITETGHYAWTASNECNETKHDEYYWSEIKSEIVFEDADTCFYMKNGILYQQMNDAVIEISDTADDVWYVWGGTSSWWSGDYNGLVLHENKLYYNGSDAVYVYNLTTKEEELHYTYKRNEGYIYGMTEDIDGSMLLLEIRTSPNEGEVEVVAVEFLEDSVETVNPGDANSDGKVNARDILLLRQYLAGGYDVTIDMEACDVNNDGKVNARDMLLMRQYLAGGYDVELK